MLSRFESERRERGERERERDTAGTLHRLVKNLGEFQYRTR
jgi:hypothetical protein